MANLVGQKFGMLKVVSREPNTPHGDAMYGCVCECGNKRSVRGSHLKSGNTKSCGCIKGTTNIKDMAGLMVGNWLVLQRDRSKGEGKQAHWLCVCTLCLDTYRTIQGQALRAGRVSLCKCTHNIEIMASEWEIEEVVEFLASAKCKSCGRYQRISIKRVEDYLPIPCFSCCGADSDRVMIHYKNEMIGNIFRGFEVEDYIPEENKWKCRCISCGVIEYRTRLNLLTKVSKDGCSSCISRKDHASNISRKEGRLTVKDIIFKEGRTYYLCECECGNEVLIRHYNFGKRFSCGCLSRTVDAETLPIEDLVPCLYLISAEDQYLKIGISIAINKRISTIQGACPLRIRTIMVVEAAREQETEIKALLSEYRLHGEWYAQTEESILLATNYMRKFNILWDIDNIANAGLNIIKER